MRIIKLVSTYGGDHNLQPATLAGQVHKPLSGLNLVPKNSELKDSNRSAKMLLLKITPSDDKPPRGKPNQHQNNCENTKSPGGQWSRWLLPAKQERKVDPQEERARRPMLYKPVPHPEKAFFFIFSLFLRSLYGALGLCWEEGANTSMEGSRGS